MVNTLNTLAARAGYRLRLAAVALVGAVVALMVSARASFAQTSPISSLQSTATNAATDSVGLIVAVVTITLAVMFGLWAIKKARSS